MSARKKAVLKGGIKIGAIFPTNNDGDVLVTELISSVQIRICFLKYPYETIVSSSSLRKGKIKNPLHPSVYDIGCIGIGRYGPVIHGKIKAYKTWSNLLQRVYKPTNEAMTRCYMGVSVHPHWHNYQNFADWYHDQCVQFRDVSFRFAIDKDLLVPGNRQYIESACCVIPEQINSLLNDRFASRGELPLGVSWTNGSYQARINIFGKPRTLGTYRTIAEAQLAYWSEKFRVIRFTAMTYKNYLPNQLAIKLMNFDWKDAHEYYGEDAQIWSD